MHNFAIGEEAWIIDNLITGAQRDCVIREHLDFERFGTGPRYLIEVIGIPSPAAHHYWECGESYLRKKPKPKSPGRELFNKIVDGLPKVKQPEEVH